MAVGVVLVSPAVQDRGIDGKLAELAGRIPTIDVADGMPDLRAVDQGATKRGSGGFGIERRGAYRVTSVDSEQLMPPWLALLLVLTAIIFAWRRESV